MKIVCLKMTKMQTNLFAVKVTFWFWFWVTGEGMGGSLYWRELIDLAHGVGFSTPSLVSSSAIMVHDPELKEKAGTTISTLTFFMRLWRAFSDPALNFPGDIRYASCTYRMFKLPKATVRHGATVTYKGTVAEFPEKLDFDSVNSFKVQ